MKHSFHPAAREELLAAIAYYNSIEPELGMAFLEEIEAAIALAGNFPDLWMELGDGVRRCLVRRFPYAVLYARESDRLYILAIMHTKRKPGYWLDRRNGP